MPVHFLKSPSNVKFGPCNSYIVLYIILCIFFTCYVGCWTFTGKCCTGFIHKHICFFTHSHFISWFLQKMCWLFLHFVVVFFFLWFVTLISFIILSCMLLFSLACSIRPTSILKGSRRKRVSLPPLGKVTRAGVDHRLTPNGKVLTLIWAEKPCCARPILHSHKMPCLCYNLCCFCSILSNVLCGCCFLYWNPTCPHHLPPVFCLLPYAS